MSSLLLSVLLLLLRSCREIERLSGRRLHDGINNPKVCVYTARRETRALSVIERSASAEFIDAAAALSFIYHYAAPFNASGI